MFHGIGTLFALAHCQLSHETGEGMLVERGIQVLNLEVVGDAYAIASNYLRKSGAIADTLAPNEPLLEIIVKIFQRGEQNKVRLANRAIAKFQSRQAA